MLSLLHRIKGIPPVYPISFAFVVINIILLAMGFFYFSAIPLVVLLLVLAFTSLDRFFYVTLFFVPLSIPLSRIIGKFGVDLYIPTEPLLAGVLLLLLLKFIRGESIDGRILKHPVSIAIYFNIAWIFISSLFSTMPMVSFKFLLVRIWFVAGFYFLVAQIFRKRENLARYLWIFLIPMTLVIIYVLIRLSGYGFGNQQASNFVVDPFYTDHTSYGAILAMLIPPLAGFVLIYRKKIIWIRILTGLLVLIFITALVLSYTRAAWLSMIGAIGIWIFIRLKIRWYYLFLGFGLVLLLVFNQKEGLLYKLGRNKQESSGKFTEHFQSVSNIRNDASNLERINRWSCALRMFREKPVFGWGPGTYMFRYAPFQKSWQKTRISTNTGTLGNAHSEYLGPLAEQGLFGLISILSVIGLTLWTGLRVFATSTRRNIRILILSVILGLCTYYIHGVLNNFLDIDKASALFWGFTAMIVSADLYHKKKKVPAKKTAGKNIPGLNRRIH